MTCRVRFAPSPTGPLHMGGVRTALFNYLFTRKNKGSMILRIEDTDQKRYVPGAEEYIMEALAWCGIEIDEGVREGGEYGPYRQSERKDMYRQYADQLIESGWAYFAFDTAEELDASRQMAQDEGGKFSYDAATRKGLRNSLTLPELEVKALIEAGEPYVIRFKFPENEEIVMNDLIRGEVRVQTSTLDDKVLFKSDGMPTYHLANVVDDHLMKISHVIRGEEWLPSMPLHVMLYRAFGWTNTQPEFAHLPLILKPSGNGKLSKRDGDKLGFPVFPIDWKNPENDDTASGYRESGYLPQAFINMLALLGWNPGTEQEIFSMDELIELFSLERVGKSGSRFDPEKSKNLNHQYIQMQDNVALGEMLVGGNRDMGTWGRGDFGGSLDMEKVVKVLGLVKERMNFLTDFWDQAYFFFVAPEEYDAKMLKKGWKEGTADRLTKMLELIHGSDFSAGILENVIKGWMTDNEIGMGAVMNPLRMTLVGAPKGPGVFDIMEVLGEEETIKRIQQAISTLG
ncbi:MAG: glutamate--tRNA ligase [Bacteroidetes bacterium]|nr:glutamate--tRNA ligase [Bacteroidota bacterium]